MQPNLRWGQSGSHLQNRIAYGVFYGSPQLFSVHDPCTVIWGERIIFVRSVLVCNTVLSLPTISDIKKDVDLRIQNFSSKTTKLINYFVEVEFWNILSWRISTKYYVRYCRYSLTWKKVNYVQKCEENVRCCILYLFWFFSSLVIVICKRASKCILYNNISTVKMKQILLVFYSFRLLPGPHLFLFRGGWKKIKEKEN